MTLTVSPCSRIPGSSRLGQHLDIGQRFGEDNRFGARVNLMQREGDTGIDHENQRSKLFAIGLDYRGDALRISGDFAYPLLNEKGPAASRLRGLFRWAVSLAIRLD